MRLSKFSVTFLAVFMFISSGYASDIYDSDPTFSPYYAGSVRSDVLYNALSELNYIRWLIGVPNNVTLDSEFTRKAQHGAVLLDAINTLTHTPGRPSDMSTSFYELGYDATSHGNIARAQIYNGSQLLGNMTLSYSTKLYMNDSDSSNISAVGHRRWLMNPRMTRTGFGISTRKGYAVTYVVDEQGNSSWPISDEYITWPTGKHPHPLTYFDAGTAWCVILNNEIFSTAKTSTTTVSMTRNSDGRTWIFSGSSSNGYYRIDTQSIAVDQCIIFRPDDVSGYSDGETWTVRINGLNRKDGTSGSISYIVTFAEESTGYEEDKPSLTQPRESRRNSGSGGCESKLGLTAVIPVIMLLGVRRRKSSVVAYLESHE